MYKHEKEMLSSAHNPILEIFCLQCEQKYAFGTQRQLHPDPSLVSPDSTSNSTQPMVWNFNYKVNSFFKGTHKRKSTAGSKFYPRGRYEKVHP